MKHKHRIKPGYEGGVYEDGNVVLLTPTQHAMWHFAEWQRKGNWQDRVAWQALSGVIGKEEITQTLQSEAGKNRAAQMRADGDLFFDPIWQSIQGTKGGLRNVELYSDEMISRCLENVKIQLQTGTHPFQKENRSWDESLSTSKAAKTQVKKGIHPFQQQNWDRKLAGQRSAATRKRLGINPADQRDKGPNYDIVQENKERIEQWFTDSRGRIAKNGRSPGAKVCNDELNLGLSSLTPLVTFLKKIKNV